MVRVLHPKRSRASDRSDTGGMNIDVWWLAAMLAAIGSALMGGVFFAFSTFVMTALRRLPAPAGIAAMQAINVAAINPMFMLALFATAAACGAVIYVAWAAWPGRGSAYLLAGGLSYLLGTILVTIVCNVPRNNRLAAADPAAAAATQYWDTYVKSWTAWNHVRTIAATIAAVLITFALQTAP
jgi:uncharacterized membrane protein